MQQTEKYKLNLIESSDPFLPEALNQNTQKVEEVLSENLEGMDARVTVLEAHKFACGVYIGNSASSVNNEQFIPLPFTPKAVVVWYPHTNWYTYACIEGYSLTPFLRWAENGFIAGSAVNDNNVKFPFIAFR